MQTSVLMNDGLQQLTLSFMMFLQSHNSRVTRSLMVVRMGFKCAAVYPVINYTFLSFCHYSVFITIRYRQFNISFVWMKIYLALQYDYEHHSIKEGEVRTL